MPHATTAQAVRALFRAYGAGDREAVAAIIDEDIDWSIHAPVAVFPFAGPRRGRAAVLQAMADIAKDYAVQQFVLEQTIVEGERAAVVANAAWTQRSTGRLLRIRAAHILRFRKGKLVEFREFLDSFDAAEQAIGTWIEVRKPPTA